MENIQSKIFVDLSVSRKLLADCIIFQQDKDLTQNDKDNNLRLMKINSILYNVESLLSNAFYEYKNISKLAKEYKHRLDYSEKILFHLRGISDCLNTIKEK